MNCCEAARKLQRLFGSVPQEQVSLVSLPFQDGAVDAIKRKRRATQAMAIVAVADRAKLVLANDKAFIFIILEGFKEIVFVVGHLLVFRLKS